MNHSKTRTLALLGVLTAIILLMAFTPIGYLRLGFVEITFIMIPVVVGAVVLGPAGGAILGCVFGLTSFFQCFGMSQFGVMLLTVNPIYAFIVCVVSRFFAGWLPGLIFKGLKRRKPGAMWTYMAACFSGSFFNTLLFVGLLAILYRDTMLAMATEQGLSFMDLLIGFVGLNGIVEMAVCLIVGTAITKTIHYAAARIH